MDRQGNVYVAGSWNRPVQVFDASGRLVRQWDTTGSPIGEFRIPVNVAAGGVESQVAETPVVSGFYLIEAKTRYGSQ